MNLTSFNMTNGMSATFAFSPAFMRKNNSSNILLAVAYTVFL